MSVFDKIFKQKLDKLIHLNNISEIPLEFEIAFGKFNNKSFNSNISFEKFKLLLSKHDKFPMTLSLIHI